MHITSTCIAIPTPTMPNPNALDIFLQAEGQLKCSIKLHTAPAANAATPLTSPNGAPPPAGGGLPAHSNAAAPPATLDLANLQQYLSDKEQGRNNQNLPVDPTPAEMQALVRANAPGFATLRRAFQYEYREPPIRSFGQLMPHFAHLREVARHLHTAGWVHCTEGDWNGAMDDELDAIQMGEMVPRGGGILNMLVGVALQSIGRTDVWSTAPHLNAAQACAAAHRLETVTQAHVPFADTLQEDKWSSEASLLELFRKPDWRNELKTFFGNGNSATPPAVQMLRIVLINKREVLINHAAYLDASIANAKLPYAAPKTLPAIPNDPINQNMLQDFSKVRLKETISEAQNTLLEVTLALRAYQLDHGQYPAQLSALVPGYLHAIPNDPFALTGPLRYKLQGQQYVLYSVGPDGKDDGGVPSRDGIKPKPAPAGTRPNPSFIDEHSSGDIVAGVNVR